jgi:hypothetical protein
MVWPRCGQETVCGLACLAQQRLGQRNLVRLERSQRVCWSSVNARECAHAQYMARPVIQQPNGENEFSVSMPSSRCTSAARSRARARTEEEGRRGEVAHWRRWHIVATVVDSSLREAFGVVLHD